MNDLIPKSYNKRRKKYQRLNPTSSPIDFSPAENFLKESKYIHF